MRAENFTDTGNARRLVAAFGERIRWVPTWSAWIILDGTRWTTEQHRQLDRHAKTVAGDILMEVVGLADAEDRKRAFRWAMKSESAPCIAAMIALARSEPGISIAADRLDRDPWLLNVRNGTIDLRTGELRPHQPPDLITKLAPVTFDPTATCPVWEQFLATVLPDPELVAYVRRVVGYSLTGSVAEQALFFAHGAGANGKTTMLRTVQRILGDCATQASTDVVTAADARPTGIARLQGARMVVASELDDGRRLAEATVKALTGGDRQTARMMRQDFFEFDPTWTFWLSANHRPIIKGTDQGIWRRVKLIPFNVIIPPDQQDRDLGAKLEAEAPGILNWALSGCLDWQVTAWPTLPPSEPPSPTTEARWTSSAPSSTTPAPSTPTASSPPPTSTSGTRVGATTPANAPSPRPASASP
jgi:putative DNA primase/helicase